MSARTLFWKTKNSILRLKSAGEPSQRASQTLLFPTVLCLFYWFFENKNVCSYKWRCVINQRFTSRKPRGRGNATFAARQRRLNLQSKFITWRCVFENIRTDFINGLGGRKGKDRTPFPPTSPWSGSEKDDFKFSFDDKFFQLLTPRLTCHNYSTFRINRKWFAR